MSLRRSPDERDGVILILSSAGFFSLMSLAVRLGRDTFRAESLVFYRSLIQVCFLLPWLSDYFQPLPGVSPKKRIQIHFLRGTFGIAAMVCLYHALQLLPLGLAVLLSMSSVLWATFFAWLFLGEKARSQQVFFASVICGGIFLSVFSPTEAGTGWVFNPWGVVSALAAGLFTGLSLTTVKSLRRNLGSREIVFFLGLFGVVWTLPAFGLNPQIPVSLRDCVLIVGVGFFATVGQLLLTTGLKYTSNLTATLCSLQQTLLNLVLGFIILGEFPPSTFYWGAVLVVGGMVGLMRAGRMA